MGWLNPKLETVTGPWHHLLPGFEWLRMALFPPFWGSIRNCCSFLLTFRPLLSKQFALLVLPRGLPRLATLPFGHCHEAPTIYLEMTEGCASQFARWPYASLCRRTRLVPSLGWLDFACSSASLQTATTADCLSNASEMKQARACQWSRRTSFDSLDLPSFSSLVLLSGTCDCDSWSFELAVAPVLLFGRCCSLYLFGWMRSRQWFLRIWAGRSSPDPLSLWQPRCPFRQWLPCRPRVSPPSSSGTTPSQWMDFLDSEKSGTARGSRLDSCLNSLCCQRLTLHHRFDLGTRPLIFELALVIQ